MSPMALYLADGVKTIEDKLNIVVQGPETRTRQGFAFSAAAVPILMLTAA
jgi:hypothetical protein